MFPSDLCLAVDLRTVLSQPKFHGWIDNKILLPMVLCCACGSFAMGTTVDIGNEDHTILIIFFWVTSIFPCYDRGFIKHRRPENSPSTTQNSPAKFQ